MAVKNKIIFAVALALLIFSALLIPQFLVSLVCDVSVVFPENKIVDRDIYIDGVIEEQAKKDVTFEVPLVPERVMVQIGDTVKVNDVLAIIDKGATQAALFELANYSKLIPTEYLEAFNSIKISDNMLKDKIPDTLNAPASGVITDLSLVNGAVTTPKAVIATIASVGEVRLRMNVNEDFCDRINEGDTVLFKASATGDTIYEGSVQKIFPTASKVLSGTTQKTVVPIYVLPKNDNAKLKPGYTVSGVVKKQSNKNSLFLPYEAIEQDENKTEYVYCYQDGKAVRKDIKTGEEFENAVEILEGVTNGDAVILNPASIEHSGKFVRLKLGGD